MECAAPLDQCACVVQTKSKLIHHFQALLGCLCTEYLRRRQHAARKDVLLDEIRAAAIALKEFVGDDDGLDASTSALFQVARDARKVGRPVGFTDRLEHLDGSDGIVLTLAIAVVHEFEISPSGLANCLHSLLGKLKLLGGER